MYLIVGLGNPEPEYSNTRHNMGFDTINKIAKKMEITIWQTKFKGLYSICNIGSEKVILLKPQTYMNSSGESLIQFKNYYKISTENIIVVYDDIDIEKGKIKLRKQGGPGTHNGMKSVIQNLGTENFIKVRVGIGKPKIHEELADYVIKRMPNEDIKILDESTSIATEAVLEIINSGIDKAMNKFN